MLNLHDAWPGTCPLLGPALHLWVQGCPFRCPECFNPEAQPFVPARAVSPASLLPAFEEAGGQALVLSGGEPFCQATALVELCRLVRRRCPEARILAYTGFAMVQILDGPEQGQALLRQLDILVDGPFLVRQACDHPLVGSANQRIWRIGGRVAKGQLAGLKGAQIQVGWESGGRLRLVGTGSRTAHMGEVLRRIESCGVVLRPARRHVRHGLAG